MTKKKIRFILIILLIASLFMSFYIVYYNKQRFVVATQDASYETKSVKIFSLYSQGFWDGYDEDGNPTGGIFYVYNITYRDGISLRGCRLNLTDKLEQGSYTDVNIQDHIGANISLFRLFEVILLSGWVLFFIILIINIVRGNKKLEDTSKKFEDNIDKV